MSLNIQSSEYRRIIRQYDIRLKTWKKDNVRLILRTDNENGFLFFWVFGSNVMYGNIDQVQEFSTGLQAIYSNIGKISEEYTTISFNRRGFPSMGEQGYDRLYPKISFAVKTVIYNSIRDEDNRIIQDENNPIGFYAMLSPAPALNIQLINLIMILNQAALEAPAIIAKYKDNPRKSRPAFRDTRARVTLTESTATISTGIDFTTSINATPFAQAIASTVWGRPIWEGGQHPIFRQRIEATPIAIDPDEIEDPDSEPDEIDESDRNDIPDVPMTIERIQAPNVRFTMEPVVSDELAPEVTPAGLDELQTLLRETAHLRDRPMATPRIIPGTIRFINQSDHVTTTDGVEF